MRTDSKYSPISDGEPRFTVIDRDNGETFSTNVYSNRDGAERERNRLALDHGKKFALGIGEIDCTGAIDDVTDRA